MKTLAFSAAALIAGSSLASAFSLDFVGRTGQTVAPGSPLIFSIPGYGSVTIESLDSTVAEINQDFPQGAPTQAEALEFDDGEAIQITFNGAAPQNVNFAYLGLNVGTEQFTPGVVSFPQVYRLDFDHVGGPNPNNIPQNTAALESITWNAVPEPSSSLLGLLGGVALVARRRR